MSISDIFQTDNSINGQYAFLIVLALIILVTTVLLNRRKIKHTWLNFKTRHCLGRLGFKQLTNFRLPDGLGHQFNIDRLILRHDGITLLVYKRYPGRIFCADNIDNWTQMLGQKSYRFKNPLDDLDCQIKAISAKVPNVPINGFLFFDHQAEFPKGHPERVINLKSIPGELKPSKELDVEASVMSAWEKLVTMSRG